MAQWVKNLPAMQEIQETRGLIPGLGRSPGEGNGNPLQYSCLENPVDRGAWWATVHRVTKSWIQQSMQAQHSKITKMVLVRPPMTNLKMTVRADCTVPACSPPPSAYKSSHLLFVRGSGGGKGVSLWTDVRPPLPVASIWNEENFPFHQPGLLYWLWGSEQLHPPPFSNITIILLRPKCHMRVYV